MNPTFRNVLDKPNSLQCIKSNKPDMSDQMNPTNCRALDQMNRQFATLGQMNPTIGNVLSEMNPTVYSVLSQMKPIICSVFSKMNPTVCYVLCQINSTICILLD